MPALDHGEYPNWDFEQALDSVAKRLEHIANRVEDLFTGEHRFDSKDGDRMDPLVDDDRDSAPPNPLRHWRWE